jgi:polyhydroxyalkanoate synthase subunit PhaC
LGRNADAHFLDFIDRTAANFWCAPRRALPSPAMTTPNTPTNAVAEWSLALQQEWLARQTALWQTFLSQGSKAAEPVRDKRFSDPAWAESPVFDYLRHAYLINADYLKRVGELMPAEDERSKQRQQFLVQQYIDAIAPSNFAATNPEFIKAAIDSGGESIQRGLHNMLADLEKGRVSMTDESAFTVGVNLATTQGAVVFENEVFQLIQYSPLSEKVAQRPLLIVPPCINKFYILDLQPHNSLVRYAVEQGFTVFLVSWRNVKDDAGHLTWDDYVETGVLTAIRVTSEISAVKQINALGFCVGGTLLGSALAVAKARGEDPVKALTLLTSLLDFSESGELNCFVDEVTLAAQEKAVGKGGIVPGKEFAMVFSSLRANDLIWQYVVRNYLMGTSPSAFDLLYWNSDSTNLPGPFLTWYLRNMYLENNLSVPDKLSMCGVAVDIGQLDMPAFVLATREDHIVPWRGAYRSRQLLGGPSTFVLGASGHIAGVVNPAGANKRSYWVGTDDSADAERWLASAKEVAGSWWPKWSAWLHEFGGKKIKARATLGNTKYAVVEPAPGRYVKERA